MRTKTELYFKSFTSFPSIGSFTCLYIAIDTNTIYRWNGVGYISLSVNPTDLANKQDLLINQTNIKSINGNSLLGSGDLQVASGSGGVSANTYFTTLTSTTVGSYKQVSYIPEAIETILSGVVNNNEILLNSYIYDGDVGITNIPAGDWSFHFHGYSSTTANNSYIRFEPFKRSASGIETTLFSITSQDLNTTTSTAFVLSSTQPQYTVNTTDRLGCRVYVSTDRTSNTTISFIVGDGNASYLLSPLPLRASLIRNTPAGNITSLDVQGALNQLDTLKANKKYEITIPGDLVADSVNHQGIFHINTEGKTITINNVIIKVAGNAVGGTPACVLNIYKSSGTLADGMDTNSTALFSPNIDLGSGYSYSGAPTSINTVEADRYITTRITNSVGTTKKANDMKIIIFYS